MADETLATISTEQLRLLYLVAGAAESLVAQAEPLQEQFDPESFEVTAWCLFHLRDALANLDEEESKPGGETDGT